MRRWLVALLLPLAAGAAPPGDVERFAREFDAYAETVIDAARDARSPRVLVAAATFADGNPLHRPGPAIAAKRDELIERAKRLGAEDPVVWWLLASDADGKPAERAQAIRRLRDLAPNNAAGWLLPMPSGDASGDDFARAARSNRVDLYDGEYVRALYAAARAVPAPGFALEQVPPGTVAERERDAHLLVALGEWMERVLPPLGGFGERCGRVRELAGTARERCLALARLMAGRSRNVLMQRIGTAFLVRRLPAGEERGAAADARRRLDWLGERSLALVGSPAWFAGARRWLDPDGDELAVMAAQLRAQGTAPEPPPGWRSDAPPVAPAALD